MTAGYSGTPLAKKLGVKDGQKTWHLAMPAHVLNEILAAGALPQIHRSPPAGLEMAHIFVTERSVLRNELKRLRTDRRRRRCLDFVAKEGRENRDGRHRRCGAG